MFYSDPPALEGCFSKPRERKKRAEQVQVPIICVVPLASQVAKVPSTDWTVPRLWKMLAPRIAYTS